MPARRAWFEALAALVVYWLLALALFGRVWTHPAQAWIGDAKDPKLFLWYLGWFPHQLSAGQNPLVTDFVAYPQGTNLMWNTSVPFPAVLIWPVTAVWGPVVAYNLLVTSGIAFSAWLGFLAARRFLGSWGLAFFAGLVYGFSPGMLAQATRHLHVVIELFPPLMLILADEVLVRRRRSPVLLGALAGLATALQLLTGEEVLAVTALVALVGVGLLALLNPGAVAARIGFAARAGALALVVFTVLAGYPLWVQFFGHQRVFGHLQPQDVYVSDLLAFVVPSQFSLVQSPTTAWMVWHFTGNPSENNAYVGLPLLALFAAGLALNWRRPGIRWAGLLTIAIAILSLGPHLHVSGFVSPLPLPWLAVEQLPLMDSALPARLMLPAFLGVGIVTASVWDPLRRARPAWRGAAGLAAALGLVFLLPSLPFPEARSDLPAFFQPGGDASRLLPGQVVLVAPFSSHNSTEAMYWQAAAGYRFRMPEGDVFTPGPYLGPHPTDLQSSLDTLLMGGQVTVTDSERQNAIRDLNRSHAEVVVVGPNPGRDAMVRYFTEVLGYRPEISGGVVVWWVIPCC
ncbi:MAG TPA: hypothetical protein VK131_11585 [Candidatus Acidoferrales bacterium]|nr:hypothetical protein [Candidatus Acidoferrales bacterium]